MANLREIRNRIATVKSTQQITKAMKMVAAARLKKAQDRVVATRPYAGKLRDVMAKLAPSAEGHPMFAARPDSGNVLLIVVGSDRGLCGGFNSNLFRYTEEMIRARFADAKAAGTLHLVTVGRKATDHFRRRGYTVVRSHAGFFDKIRFESAAAVMRTAADEFLSGRYDAVFLAYNEFKSVMSQNRMMEQVLPIPTAQTEDTYPADYLFEPDAKGLLETILPLHLNTQIWRAVLESNAGEQGARMAAMDSATENAAEIMRALQLTYNQARQAAITTEISEIVSGAEALKA